MRAVQDGSQFVRSVGPFPASDVIVALYSNGVSWTRYRMTSTFQSSSRITTVDGFRQTRACQRTAPPINNISRGQLKAARQ
jgi:hypothetical protein